MNKESILTESTLTSVTAVLTGLIALLIALPTWRQEQLKIRIELYARRLDIFQRLFCQIRELHNFNVAEEVPYNIERIVQDGQFLFGEEISEYMNELSRKAIDLRQAQRVRHSAEFSANEKEKNHRLEKEIIAWVENEIKTCHRRFAKYLRLGR